MLSLKKVYRDELLQLALILSLLRVNPESYLETDLYRGVNNLDLDNGTSWRSYSQNILRSHFIHPKNLDSVLLNYEREVFEDLNSLGRYNRQNLLNRDVTAYLLNIERTSGGSAALGETEVLTDLGASSQPQQEDSTINIVTDSTLDSTEAGLDLSQEVSTFLFYLNRHYIQIINILNLFLDKCKIIADIKSSKIHAQYIPNCSLFFFNSVKYNTLDVT